MSAGSRRGDGTNKPSDQSVAAITAMPAPCGVGIMRGTRIRPRQRIALQQGRPDQADHAAESTAARSAADAPQAPSLRRLDLRRILGGLLAQKIHTSPPTAPTMKETAPNSSEMLTPSLVASPA